MAFMAKSSSSWNSPRSEGPRHPILDEASSPLDILNPLTLATGIGIAVVRMKFFAAMLFGLVGARDPRICTQKIAEP
jgi:hypothetical protein